MDGFSDALRVLLVAVSLLADSAVWAAGVYRWVDESGGVHYGDHPPAAGATPVEVAPATKRPQGLRPQEKALLERIDRRERFDKREARLDRQQQASARRVEDRRAQSCERARREVEVLQAQLRDGYTAERGVRLERDLGFSREDVRRYCR